MKISYLLLLGCFLYISVCDVRGNVTNIIEEFKVHFKEYLNQESSKLACFNVLKNLKDVCPCAVKQLENIQEGFQNQNSTEVVMMKKNLQVLIDQLVKSGKSKDQSKQPGGKQEECKFECRNPERTVKNVDDFFWNLKKRRCFKGSRK